MAPTLDPHLNLYSPVEIYEDKTSVTAVTKLLPKTVTSQNPEKYLVEAVTNDLVTNVTEKINKTETEQTKASVITEDSSPTNPVTNSGNSGNTVTVDDETQSPRQLQLVTSFVTGSPGNLVTRDHMALSATPELLQLQSAPTTEIVEVVEPREAIARPYACRRHRRLADSVRSPRPGMTALVTLSGSSLNLA